MNQDIQQIKSNGGVSVVAKQLGYSYQRVNNWVIRGRVPPQVKLDNPDLFPQEKKPSAQPA